MATNGSTDGVNSLTEPFPDSAIPPRSCIVNGFTISAQKLPILKAGPIEEMNLKLKIPVPEMIFGDNYVEIKHNATGWSINFNAFDALDRVDKTGESMLQVAHSGEWQKSREHHHEGIKEVVKPFDWSYSTDYSGTVLPGTAQGHGELVASDKPLPLSLLARQDPIRFYEDLVLYEDELADNGITMLSVKVRVMPERLLLLSRFFMRLDGVVFRIRDTRVYVEFATGEVIREYIAREDKYETVRHKMAMRGQDVPAMLRDANRLSELLPVVEKKNENLVLK